MIDPTKLNPTAMRSLLKRMLKLHKDTPDCDGDGCAKCHDLESQIEETE